MKREEALDRLFGALSDRTRRAMLAHLSKAPARMGELAAPFDMSLPAIGKHVRVLEKAGLVRRRVTGRIHVCTLDPKCLQGAAEWLSFYRNFWTESLDALAEVAEDEDGG